MYVYILVSMDSVNMCAYFHKQSENKEEIKYLQEQLTETNVKLISFENAIKEMNKKLEDIVCKNKIINVPLSSTDDEMPVLAEEFKCDLCDFSSLRKNGLIIHVGRKHKDMSQLDENTGDETFSEDSGDNGCDGDEIYDNTKVCWKRGQRKWSKNVFGDDFKYIPLMEIISLPNTLYSYLYNINCSYEI